MATSLPALRGARIFRSAKQVLQPSRLRAAQNAIEEQKTVQEEAEGDEEVSNLRREWA